MTVLTLDQFAAIDSSSADAPLVLPTAYSGCVGYFFAHLESYSNGAAVPSVTNRATGGVFGAQATGANQPTMARTGISNKPALRFTAASSQYLDIDASLLSALQNVGGGTILAVGLLASQPASGFLCGWSSGAAAGHLRLGVLNVGGTQHVRTTGASLDADVQATVTDTGTVTDLVTPRFYIGTGDFTAGLIRVSSATGAEQTTAITAGNTSNTASDRARVGGSPINAGISSPYDGWCCAVAAWNVAYTATQLRPLLANWASHWRVAFV